MRSLAVVLVVFTAFPDCLAQFPPLCDLPMDEGTGDGYFIRLYYDKTKDICNPFSYKGQGGNENRFITDKMCMRNCSSKANEIYPFDETNVCHFKKSTGHCLSHYLLWFYDSVDEKCKNFHYSGCGGNGNRFISQQICNDTCNGIHDEGNPEYEETDTPIGLIIGIVLGILGVIIIIVAVVMVQKNKKSSNKKHPKGNELPLQEGVEMS